MKKSWSAEVGAEAVAMAVVAAIMVVVVAVVVVVATVAIVIVVVVVVVGIVVVVGLAGWTKREQVTSLAGLGPWPCPFASIRQ